jgi:hypothetical protein
MGARLRALAVVVVVLLVGTFVGSAWSQWWGRRSGGSGAPGQGAPHVRVRVEVLNAGGSQGAARVATDRLRDKGFDVVFFGNAQTFGRDSSVVLDRTGHLDEARGVADALGIHKVRSEPDSNLYLDVSVLLGRDWEAGNGRASAVSQAPKRAWWDPRRWLKR